MSGLIRFFVFSLLIFATANSFSYVQPCQLVAQVAGDHYETRPVWFASLSPPANFKAGLKVELVERNGAWFIYKGHNAWFDLDECSTKHITVEGKTLAVLPTLYNQQTTKSAIINGTFIIKVYRVDDLKKIAKRYRFKKVSPLPNRFAAIFDVRPQLSYDRMIEILDGDRDIEFVIPVLSEPD